MTCADCAHRVKVTIKVWPDHCIPVVMIYCQKRQMYVALGYRGQTECELYKNTNDKEKKET